MNTSERAEKVLYYHERTKHSPQRYARSPGFMDWANEPVPFRVFEGAPLLKLPLGDPDPPTMHVNMYRRENNQPCAFSITNIGKWLELSLGLSAWKAYGGNKWALRMNPSSGNLHPTEAHLILPPLPECEGKGTISHYNPLYHALEMRASFDESLWGKLANGGKETGFFVALSSIYWRESWKYGERAFRYSNLDVGHALASLSFSANLLGWKVSAVNSLAHEEIEKLFGFQKAKWKAFEKEEADILLFVHNDEKVMEILTIPGEVIDAFCGLPFGGEPNTLSKGHEEWHIIDEVALMTRKEKTYLQISSPEDRPFEPQCRKEVTAASLIRHRRSAQSYDGRTFIEKGDFFALLDKTIARSRYAPFDMISGQGSVNLFLFVHRVKDLDAGLYFFARESDDFEEIKESCRTDFLWEKGEQIPEKFPLYLLKRGNYTDEAAMMSCRQEIAGESAFSLTMIARFRETIENEPSSYRRLFWECGMIGQILYLEAEFAGQRGTGIGCFYDDLVHEFLGIKGDKWQSLYHFTIGGPLEDKRLSTLPPYDHLEKKTAWERVI